MKVTLQKQEKNQVCMEVEVDASQVTDAYEKRFREASKSVNIPGFRKGKAPRKIIEKYIHTDMVKQDVLEYLVSDSYSEALRNLEEPIEPISEPKIELVKFDLNEPLVFKATLEVKPEIKLGEFEGLNIEVDPVDEITDKDIDEEIENIRKRHGKLENVERAIQNDDVVTLDIYGEVEGEPIPQGATDNLQMEIKPDNFVPGFTEQLIGANAGEEKTIDVVFPENYAVVDLRGKEGKFKVNIKEIKELKLPELNDEFAHHMGEGHMDNEVNTVDDLKARVKSDLVKSNEFAQMMKNQQTLIETIVNASEVEVPESMERRELYAMWSNSEGRTLSERNIAKEVLQASWENYISREEMVAEARKRIKTTLVLSEVAKVKDITVTAEELNSELDKFAMAYQVPREQLREQLIKNDRMIPLIDELLSLKIVNWIESNSKVSVKGAKEEKSEDKAE
ncbi:MAG: trigger factor [Candidatus Sericytochromatia bacterium]